MKVDSERLHEKKTYEHGKSPAQVTMLETHLHFLRLSYDERVRVK